jgi:hypothetical protein
MDKAELENWQRVKDHFDKLPEEQRNNYFYQRAVVIVSGAEDPLPPVEFKDKDS